ncbi:hypothetical protein MUS_1644 [Bacillus velezensis YAU B9601-Y2]|uniref:Uncharacterized protein n=1 Tax=Bacillus amyloliquefaciens (strain Y2) TaxID=1155777 RepID=I2C4S0_BACAY|nr:hypothetical protein MUS_1644 [Bacillus velezensis YAU B9601-Y2]RUS05606.1 hypothetical protein EFW58_01645 [Bacillus velezensis]
MRKKAGIFFSAGAPLAKKHKKTAGDAPLCGFYCQGLMKFCV